MSEEKKALQPTGSPEKPAWMNKDIKAADGGVQLRSYEEIVRLANAISASDIIPDAFRKNPSNCLVALLHGLEIGLKPMQTFKSIMVVNGIPSIYGDAALALCRKSSLMDVSFGSGGIKEWSEGEGESLICYCETKRAGAAEAHKSSFSWKDALAAGLAQNDKKLYKKYPKRMCGFRARGFELRDNFGDVLLGMVTVEEAMDYEIIDTATGEIAEMPSVQSRPKFDQTKVAVPVEAEFSEQEEPSGFESEEQPPISVPEPIEEKPEHEERAPKKAKANQPELNPELEAEIAEIFPKR